MAFWCTLSRTGFYSSAVKSIFFYHFPEIRNCILFSIHVIIVGNSIESNLYCGTSMRCPFVSGWIEDPWLIDIRYFSSAFWNLIRFFIWNQLKYQNYVHALRSHSSELYLKDSTVKSLRQISSSLLMKWYVHLRIFSFKPFTYLLLSCVWKIVAKKEKTGLIFDIMISIVGYSVCSK